MKAFTSILILCFFVSTSSIVAQKGNRGQKEERLQALRVSFITMKLQLTPKESQDFWPIYNEYTKKRKNLIKSNPNHKPGKKPDLTDKQAADMVDASFELQEKQLALKRRCYSRLKKVISPTKLVLLEKTERQFRQKVAKEIKRRKEEKRRKRRN